VSQKLVDAVYGILKQDESFMAHFGLSPSSSPEDIVKRIVKGMEPDQALSSSIVPLVTIYVKPGRYGRNHLVYEGKFCIDIYGKNAAQARTIAERIFGLFHDDYLVGREFRSFRCSLAYDADFATGISGVKGYEVIYDVDYIRAR
jgi:hypothetical protein